eukprot:TRINITY_DN23634_c0_g1_i1.p1 TRINITY_DN23634_c0_g1~~TRINITY_DN23634_c0_g1_i1.p1  ORF type:complete len:159 (+),score=32.91 TRINITY_DN23634_c0_g1_i1:32-508(+)
MKPDDDDEFSVPQKTKGGSDGQFSKESSRGLVLLIILGLSTTFESPCDEELEAFRTLFIWGQLLFYVLLIINTLLRTFTSLTIGFATIYYSVLTYACGLLALYLLLTKSKEECTPQSSLIAMLAYMMILNAILRIATDIIAIYFSCLLYTSPSPRDQA